MTTDVGQDVTISIGGGPRIGLERIDALLSDAEIIIGAVEWLDGVGDKVLMLAQRLDEIVQMDPDAAIAAVHLGHHRRPSIAQAVYTAILCSLTARRLKQTRRETHLVIAAALTANVGVLRLQDELLTGTGEPNSSQLMALDGHPERSVELLRATGVEDLDWLTIVGQHHERPDGNGYPLGLSNDAIRWESLMLGLAERYTTCVMPHPHRPAQSTRHALREVFEDDSYADADAVVNAFIKELTVYPPGTILRMTIGSEAVVVRRTADALRPYVATIDFGMVGPLQQIVDGRREVAEYLPSRRIAAKVEHLWHPR